MVIGSLGLADLAAVLGKVEKRLGREVNVTDYSVDEFRRKVAEWRQLFDNRGEGQSSSS